MGVRPKERPVGFQPAERDGGLGQGSVFFAGAATTVISLGGFTILTDPDFLRPGDEAAIGPRLTTERLTEPAIGIAQLPPLDLCVLSHVHGDRWNHAGAEHLPRSLPIVTTRQAARVLERQGFRGRHPLRPWQGMTIRKGDRWLKVTSTPARHGPGLVGSLLPEVMGSILEWGRGSGEAGFRMHVSGDTVYYEGLRQIKARFARIDLALLHLGGARIPGATVTMDAGQGMRWVNRIAPALTIPISYDDYAAFTSPLRDFVDAVERASMDGHVQYLGRGQTYTFNVLSD
jgi:L-ascorbate metabolism protein UlaG (beta-lactamase superfamily)